MMLPNECLDTMIALLKHLGYWYDEEASAILNSNDEVVVIGPYYEFELWQMLIDDMRYANP